MMNNKKLLILCLFIPLAVGGGASLISGGGMDAFETLNKPPLSPPGILFPIVWTILYLLMGAASYFVIASDSAEEKIRSAVTLYGIQLFFNFLWPILFFSFFAYLLSFLWLVALLILIILTALSFYKIKNLAGYLLIPYIAWVTFAGYLNFGVFVLN